MGLNCCKIGVATQVQSFKGHACRPEGRRGSRLKSSIMPKVSYLVLQIYKNVFQHITPTNSEGYQAKWRGPLSR